MEQTVSVGYDRKVDEKTLVVSRFSPNRAAGVSLRAHDRGYCVHPLTVAHSQGTSIIGLQHSSSM